MDVEESIRKRRSIRRFSQKKINRSVLIKLIDGARVAPSSGNRQPLKYIIVDDEKTLSEVFSTLGWALYLGKSGTPIDGQRPVAYVIVAFDYEIASEDYKHDSGLAVENILLLAVANGLGSCCIGSVNSTKLKKILSLPKNLLIDLVIALGFPLEEPVIEEMNGDSIKYWRDNEGIIHVPKRKLEDIIFWNKVSWEKG